MVVVVVGAGVMGRGIAQVAAVAGQDVTLVDQDPDQLERAVAAIRDDLEGGVARGKVDADVPDAALGRIATSQDLAAACVDADVVVEAVVEDVAVKHDVLRTAERAAPAQALLATNTSALSITELAAALDSPSRLVGAHFFNPVPRMRLVELVRGLDSSAQAMDAAEGWATGLGKETVRVEDLPGFATSRINALIGNEGMRMLEEGVASPEDVDTAVRLGLNHPMGPLEMGDLVGWDTRLRILEHLADTLGERFRPTNLQRRLVAAGRYGRKSGRGVYRYDDDGRRTDEPSDLGGR